MLRPVMLASVAFMITFIALLSGLEPDYVRDEIGVVARLDSRVLIAMVTVRRVRQGREDIGDASPSQWP